MDFEDAVKQGRAQADLVAQAERLGADGIEVRREYFKDLATELTAVRDAADVTERHPDGQTVPSTF